MLKYVSLLSLLLVCSLFANPDDTTHAGLRDTTNVGPGVIYYSEFIEEGPWQIDVMEIDLTNQWLNVETVKADDQLFGLERTTSMAARNNYEGHKVVGAVNADFYNTANGEPLGTQIIKGEFLKVNTDWRSIGFDVNNLPFMGLYGFAGSVITADTVAQLHGINRDRLDEELILYNKFKGNTTLTNQWGSEVRFKLLGDWFANDTLTAVAIEREIGVGSMSLDDSTFVLAGHGGSNLFLQDKIADGDTIKLFPKLGLNRDKLTAMVGGSHYLVQNGVVVASDGDRHPRTAAGFSADSTKLYLMTVDGRQPGYSIGMSLKELGQYMLSIGAANALNLDGGGSTTMVVRSEIKNSPSDPGGERSVSNSLLIVSSAPTGPVAHLRINPSEIFILGGLNKVFGVSGVDEHYNPVQVNLSSVNWSCTPELGTIDASGNFTAADDTISGYVYAEYNGITDSARVYLTKISSIVIEPDPVILQAGELQQMNAYAFDNYGNDITISNTDYTWEVIGDMGTISPSGMFEATNVGDGKIRVTYENISAEVDVSVGVSQFILLDDFVDVSAYFMSGTRVNLSECSFTSSTDIFNSPPASGKLKYSLTTGGTSALYLTRSIPIAGTPDKVTLSVYGDGKEHWLRGEFEDKDGEKFLVDFVSKINWSGSWKELEVIPAEASPSWANPNAFLDFPITWTKIYLAETDDSKKDSGEIYLDDFKAYFITTHLDDNEGQVPAVYELEQNYPNPFNPSTKIKFSIPTENKVTIKVYDTLGRLVDTLANEIYSAGSHEVILNASNLASGVYFYTINAGDFFSVKKMQLIK
ncbi:MAG: hypothetical protein SCALA702_17870 [Melioribacteraceae bacterium]|nr:MAG: hypothetical protein SCALA702_17870 [Melioribacteraceae bacterium]